MAAELAAAFAAATAAHPALGLNANPCARAIDIAQRTGLALCNARAAALDVHCDGKGIDLPVLLSQPKVCAEKCHWQDSLTHCIGREAKNLLEHHGEISLADIEPHALICIRHGAALAAPDEDSMMAMIRSHVLHNCLEALLTVSHKKTIAHELPAF